MKVLFLASDRAELKGLPESVECRAIGTGLVMAAVNATKAIMETEADIVVNIGSAGGSASHSPGDVLMIGRVFTTDQDLSAYRLPPGSTIDEGRATVGEIRLPSDEENSLLSSSRFSSVPSDLMPDCYDMEGYAVALAADRLKKKCIVFKLVTDIVGERVSIGEYSRNLRIWRSRLQERAMEYLFSSGVLETPSGFRPAP